MHEFKTPRFFAFISIFWSNQKQLIIQKNLVIDKMIKQIKDNGELKLKKSSRANLSVLNSCRTVNSEICFTFNYEGWRTVDPLCYIDYEDSWFRFPSS